VFVLWERVWDQLRVRVDDIGRALTVVMRMGGGQDVVAGLRGTATVCCEAVAEGLRALAAGPDAQRGMRAAQRAVDTVASLSQRCAGRCQPF